MWGTLALLFAIAAAAAMWFSGQAREDAIRGATEDATLIARSDLAPMLTQRDLTAPLGAERAHELAEDVERSITASGPIERVRLYSSTGKILYAGNPEFIGTRPSYVQEVTLEAANAGSDPRSRVRDGLLETYVPVQVTSGGPAAVAELSQPLSSIVSEATSAWNLIALGGGTLFVACLVMVGVATAARMRSGERASIYRPAIPRRGQAPRSTPTPEPIVIDGDARAMDDQRRAAERRARAAEENFRSVQEQLKETLAQMRELEGRIAMDEAQQGTSDSHMEALREQLRESSERLHAAELDNTALRERMGLRQQELEEARRELERMRISAGELEQMRLRLEAAERSATEMALAVDRLERELDHTESKFHMTKLSEALREFDNDAIEIEEEDDLFEHPVIIRNRPKISTRK